MSRHVQCTWWSDCSNCEVVMHRWKNADGRSPKWQGLQLKRETTTRQATEYISGLLQLTRPQLAGVSYSWQLMYCYIDSWFFAMMIHNLTNAATVGQQSWLRLGNIQISRWQPPHVCLLCTTLREKTHVSQCVCVRQTAVSNDDRDIDSSCHSFLILLKWGINLQHVG